jgi:hypothetical protein
MLDNEPIFEVQANTYLNIITDENTFNINASADTLKEFHRAYNDLSGKLFRINVNDTQIKENGKLKFKIDESNINTSLVKIEVVGHNQNLFDPLGEGFDFTVENLKNYNTIVALVTNSNYSPPYTGTSNINLDIRVEEKSVFGYIQVKTLGKYKYNDDTISDGVYLYNPGVADVRYGTFENNKFDSSWDEPLSTGSSYGDFTFTVDLSSSPIVITDYYVKETQILTDTEVNIIEGKGVSIPGYHRSIGGYEFYITGDDACAVITKIENTYTGQGSYAWKLTEKSCDSNSYIRIILGAE